jgi:hypothetical protein
MASNMKKGGSAWALPPFPGAVTLGGLADPMGAMDALREELSREDIIPVTIDPDSAESVAWCQDVVSVLGAIHPALHESLREVSSVRTVSEVLSGAPETFEALGFDAADEGAAFRARSDVREVLIVEHVLAVEDGGLRESGLGTQHREVMTRSNSVNLAQDLALELSESATIFNRLNLRGDLCQWGDLRLDDVEHLNHLW